MKTWTTSSFRAAKGVRKLACVTAYDYTFARLADEAEIPFILVGDSAGMTMMGYDTTLPVTMDDMVFFVKNVARGARQHALVVADLPFLSCSVSVEEGIRNAGRFMQEAGADAVKFEGCRPELIRRLVDAGIPICAHLGMTPQLCQVYGGFKVQAKSRGAADQLIEATRQVAEAGAFAVVLECVPPDVAAEVTAAVSIPTIGIGAGAGCDAQILVMHDMLGLTPSSPKFVKRYADFGAQAVAAFKSYAADVAAGAFPTAATSYKPLEP